MKEGINIIKLGVEVEGVKNKEIVLRDPTFQDMNVISDGIAKQVDSKPVEFMIRVLSRLGGVSRSAIESLPASEMESVFAQVGDFIRLKLPGLNRGERQSSS